MTLPETTFAETPNGGPSTIRLRRRSCGFITPSISIESLAFMPESHPLAPENEDFPVELREQHFGLGSRPSYRAIFSITGDTVHVLTMRRAAQDRISPGDIELNF